MSNPSPNPPASSDPAKPVAPTAAASAPTPIKPVPKVTKPAPDKAAAVARPPAARAFLRRRHRIVLKSFVLVVVLPVFLWAAYLWTRAADQYASTVGFAVRKQQTSSAIELLGGITELTGSSSSDTDILYEYLQSQKLIEDLEKEVGLSKIWSKPGTSWFNLTSDPVFAYDTSGSIEDLVEYWPQMVKISYDSGTGLIEVRVNAFEPGDATLIAHLLFQRSSDMINELSDIAREDSIKYAREELNDTVDRLKLARQALMKFRNENQLIDPKIDIETQATVLASLQQDLAKERVAIDLLRDTTRGDDPRITSAKRRIEVLEQQMATERLKVGIGPMGGGDAFAALMDKYEALSVDRQFAEQSYTAALATFDAANAEARRKSRYLAAYVEPTIAETSRYPKRGHQLIYVALFLTLAWVIAVLMGYAVKDRR